MMQIEAKTYHIAVQRLSLFFIIFQSIGIRLFQGIGLALLAIIILLNFDVRKFAKNDLVILAISVFFVMFYSILRFQTGFYTFFYQLMIVLSAFFFIRKSYLSEKGESITDSLLFITRILTFHAFIGFIFYAFFPSLFYYVEGEAYSYQTFVRILYVSFGNTPWASGARSTGLCWEPGLMQLIINLYFFLLILKNKVKLHDFFFIVINIIFTYSTTGLLVLLVVSGYYFISKRKVSWLYIALALIFAAIIIPITFQNIEDKIEGKNYTSGQVRQRDLLIGFFLIKEKPLLGHGYFDMNYLIENNTVEEIDLEIMNEIFVAENDVLAGGYTNGLIDLAMKFGIPIAIFLLFLFYRNKIVTSTRERIFLFLLFLLTFIGEPITNTPLFHTFIFSALLKKQTVVAIEENPNEEDNNNHRNI